MERRDRARRLPRWGSPGSSRAPACRRRRARQGPRRPPSPCRPASRRRARSRRGRSRGTGPCGSRALPRRGSRAAPGSRRRRGSTSRRRTRPAPRCATGSSGRPTRRRCAGRRGGRRPGRPVAKTVIPACAARCAVEATVVDPTPPRAATAASSRTLTFTASSSFASRSRAASSSPTRASPSMTATVAGTAPPSRTACSNSRASRALSGRGRPWLMIVLSRATTARPSASASRTSSCTRTSRPLWCVAVSCSRAGRTHVGPARVPHPAARPGRASPRRTTRPPPSTPARCPRR